MDTIIEGDTPVVAALNMQLHGVILETKAHNDGMIVDRAMYDRGKELRTAGRNAAKHYMKYRSADGRRELARAAK